MVVSLTDKLVFDEMLGLRGDNPLVLLALQQAAKLA